MKKKKHLLRNITISLLIIAAILTGAGEFFLYYALHNDNTGYNVNEEFAGFKRGYPWTAKWIDSIRNNKVLRDSFILNKEGKKLHAWYVASPKNTGNTAVIVHGYKSSSVEMFHIGYMFNHDLQWNILLPDLEAHGLSEGSTIQMGWDDRSDVMQWIRVAKGIFASDTILVHGISMGAATTMCVAGDDNRPFVRGFIEDCGYTSVWDEFRGEMKKQFRLPVFPLLHFTSALCKLQYGWSFREASPLSQVEKCRKPMFFIHGYADDYVPTAMVYPLYEAKSEPKELWLAPDSKHANAYHDHHEEYTERTKQFISKYIK
jgi:fermentation-respiration switch protein FrsA (DUF1100 family)